MAVSHYPDLASHTIAIVEKHAGIAADHGSNFEHDLGIDKRVLEWIAGECYDEFCPHFQHTESDLDFVRTLDTVEELIMYFEGIADTPPPRRSWFKQNREQDFNFNFRRECAT